MSNVVFKIKNFQSIKNCEITLDTGTFNVINGHSSSGKSAFRRSIDALLHLNWDKSFLRKNEKETTIEAILDNTKISLLKPNNTFTFNADVYNKIGAEYSPDIKKRLLDIGIKTLNIGGDEFSIIVSSQLAPMFMIENSEAVVSKILSRIFDVDKFATAIKLVQADIQKEKVAITKNKERLDQIDSGIATVDKKISILSELVSIEEKISKMDSYNAIIKKLDNITNDIAFLYYRVKVDKILRYRICCNQHENTLRDLNKLKYQNKILLIDSYFDFNTESIIAEKLRYDVKNKILKLDLYNTLCNDNKSNSVSIMKQINQNLIKLSNAVKLTSSYLKINQGIENFTQTLNSIQEKQKSLKEELSIIKFCPTCKREL